MAMTTTSLPDNGPRSSPSGLSMLPPDPLALGRHPRARIAKPHLSDLMRKPLAHDRPRVFQHLDGAVMCRESSPYSPIPPAAENTLVAPAISPKRPWGNTLCRRRGSCLGSR